MSTKNTDMPPKTDAKVAGSTGKPPEVSTGFREPGMKGMETTTLFRVTNFELFVKPASDMHFYSTKPV